MKQLQKLSRFALLVATLASFGPLKSDGGDFTSHTFFSVKDWWQSGDYLREALWHENEEHLEMKDCGWGGAIQLAFWGSHSTNGQKLARYFMPYGKTTLNVVEFKNIVVTPDGAVDRDIEARNFNIETVNGAADDDLNNGFRSRISFCPSQRVIGAGFAWRQLVYSCPDSHSRIWLEIGFPIIKVTNNVGLTEQVLNDGGGALPALGLDGAPRVGNMIQAFRQHNWKYGKIRGPLTRHGVGDIELKLGWNNVNHGVCHFNSFVGLILPTGNRPNAQYMFEPIVGNNHHVGVMWGSNLGFDLWACGPHSVRMEFDWVNRYLFRNRQVRSFDLVRGEWSRFLSVYETPEDAQAAFLNAGLGGTDFMGTSGINVFTDCLKVSPRFSLSLNHAFIYEYCDWTIEAGWNFYARQAEKVQLDSFRQGVQVKSIVGLGATNLARTITNNFEGSDIDFTTLAAYIPLRLQDIDIESAAHPAVLSYAVYATVGHEWKECCYPTFASIGGAYEFESINTSIERWVVWGKAGISF